MFSKKLSSESNSFKFREKLFEKQNSFHSFEKFMALKRAFFMLQDFYRCLCLFFIQTGLCFITCRLSDFSRNFLREFNSDDSEIKPN